MYQDTQQGIRELQSTRTCGLEAWSSRVWAAGGRVLWRVGVHADHPSASICPCRASRQHAAGLSRRQVLLHGRGARAGVHVCAARCRSEAVHGCRLHGSVVHRRIPVRLCQHLLTQAACKAGARALLGELLTQAACKAGARALLGELGLLLVGLHERSLRQDLLLQQCGSLDVRRHPCGRQPRGKLLVAGARAVVAAHGDAGVLRMRAVGAAKAVHTREATAAELRLQGVPGAHPARHLQPAQAVQQRWVARVGAAWDPLELHVLLVQEGAVHVCTIG